MKFRKPSHGLGFLTVMWCFYALTTFRVVPDYFFSAFGALLIVGVISSLGIWANVRIFGYVFALINLVATTLYISLHFGEASELIYGVEIQREFTFRSGTSVLMLLYCVYAGAIWARSSTTTDALAG